MLYHGSEQFEMWIWQSTELVLLSWNETRCSFIFDAIFAFRFHLICPAIMVLLFSWCLVQLQLGTFCKLLNELGSGVGDNYPIFYFIPIYLLFYLTKDRSWNRGCLFFPPSIYVTKCRTVSLKNCALWVDYFSQSSASRWQYFTFRHCLDYQSRDENRSSFRLDFFGFS